MLGKKNIDDLALPPAYKTIVKVFARELLYWNRQSNQRQMPWKGEKDPYKIWLSEVILQQTRVDQGLKYYENFIRQFPDVHALAAARDEEVYKCWEGLGYYSRCRNLLTTARFISQKMNGIFPSDYNAILDLKGVGPYTAAAISSFAFNLPYAVVDGNVYRVLSRIFNLYEPIDTSEGRRMFSRMAQDLLPVNNAGEYNQAIMDFGALICKPTPECVSCFFNPFCQAFQAGTQDLLPAKEKITRIKERWLNYFVILSQDKVLIHQRSAKDIWQQLFEFLLIETEKKLSHKSLMLLLEKQYAAGEYECLNNMSFEQKLTHQLLHFNISLLKTKSQIRVPGHIWVKKTDLGKYAFPKSLQQFASLHLK